MEAWFQSLLASLALPEFGLSTVFVVSFISATLLPLGSEPAVLGLIKLNPSLFWPAIGVATVGNTLGGMVTWSSGQAWRSISGQSRNSSSLVMQMRTSLRRLRLQVTAMPDAFSPGLALMKASSTSDGATVLGSGNCR